MKLAHNWSISNGREHSKNYIMVSGVRWNYIDCEFFTTCSQFAFIVFI